MIPIVVSAFTPLVIIPGFGGSILVNKKNKESIWPPSSTKLLDSSWIKSLKLEYNENKLVPTIPTETYPIGDTKGIQIITPITKLILGSEYYYNIIKSFEKSRPTHAISYDFRIITDHAYQEKLFNDMTKFIEKTGKSTFICHSLGGLMFHYYLCTHVSKEWKDKYIDSVIFINVPFGGTVSIIEYLINDMELTIPLFFKKIKLDFIKSFGGFLWCLPNPELFGDDIILTNNDISYSAKNITLLFNNLEIHKTYNQQIKPLHKFIKKSPEVNTFHLICTNLNTTKSINIKNNIIHKNFMEGDGVVNLKSLTAPLKWNDDKFHVFIKLKGHHTDVLSEKHLIETIFNITFRNT
jgi:hypothetical protein